MSDLAIVFDLDGTLIDTETVWDDVRREMAAADGLPWPEEASQLMMGMSTQEWSNYMSQTVGLRGDATKRVIDGMRTHYQAGLTVLPGAVEAVRRMATLAPVAIASSSPRVLIEAALVELGLTEVIRTVVSTEEVAAGKPAPDGYLEACRQLGVDPANAVAVEDATNGLRSALAAGMHVVAVPQDFHRPGQELLDRCDAVLDSLDGLTEDLIRRITG